jgi:hypothetical protein
MFEWLKKKTLTAEDRFAKAVPTIISEYGHLLEKYQSAIVVDASLLPVPKRMMINAFKIAWLNTRSAEMRNWLEIGWAHLPMFQDGVGDIPISMVLPKDEPLDQMQKRLKNQSLWLKLVNAEGEVMQRDRDEFKAAHST